MSAYSDAIRTRAEAMSGDMLDGVTTAFDIYVTMAEECHTRTQWGDVYVSAMACWALHSYQKALQAANADGSLSPAGPVQSQRTGDVSVSWQASSGMAGSDKFDYDFPSTPWGVKYLFYLRTRGRASRGFVGGYTGGR